MSLCDPSCYLNAQFISFQTTVKENRSVPVLPMKIKHVHSYLLIEIGLLLTVTSMNYEVHWQYPPTLHWMKVLLGCICTENLINIKVHRRLNGPISPARHNKSNQCFDPTLSSVSFSRAIWSIYNALKLWTCNNSASLKFSFRFILSCTFFCFISTVDIGISMSGIAPPCNVTGWYGFCN